MLKISEITITPEMAQKMLEKNIENNRLVKNDNVAYYADMMKNGQWVHDNGEFIKFDKQGFMFDGQHRLHAIVKCGIPQKCYIVENCNRKSFMTVDNGKKRNLNDIFKIVGLKDASHLASVVTTYYNLINEKSANGGVTASKLSSETALLLVEKFPTEFEEALSVGLKIYKKTHHILQPSLCCSLYLIFNQIDKERCIDFFHQFMMATLEKHPATVLRRKLHDNSLRTVGRYTRSEIEQFIVIAWNAFMVGKELSVIKIKDTKQSIIGLDKVTIK